MFTYSEVTDAAEKQIVNCMELARLRRVQGDVSMARIHEAFAHGAYLGWYRLTASNRFKEDDARLAALVEIRQGPKS